MSDVKQRNAHEVERVRDQARQFSRQMQQPRARALVEEMIASLLDLSRDHHGEVVLRLQGRGDAEEWAFHLDRPTEWRKDVDAVVKEAAAKGEENTLLLQVDVDAGELEAALAFAESAEHLAFASSMRIRGHSAVIGKLARIVNRHCYARGGQ